MNVGADAVCSSAVAASSYDRQIRTATASAGTSADTTLEVTLAGWGRVDPSTVTWTEILPTAA